MVEKITIQISAEDQKFLKQYARQQNKSISRCMGDILSFIQKHNTRTHQKDEWIDKVAGSYSTGKKDILDQLFKSVVK